VPEGHDADGKGRPERPGRPQRGEAGHEEKKEGAMKAKQAVAM